MISFLPFIAPIALALPALAGSSDAEHAQETAKLDPKQVEDIAMSKQPVASDALSAPAAQQIRIERRVIVRIAPMSRTRRASLVAETSQPSQPQKLVERKMGKCIPLSRIARVQPSGGKKLRLLMQDRSLVSLRLEKSCRARDFYSGFYVEKNKDGKLCVDRDELLSRSGAKCEFEKLRQLVSVPR